MNSNKILDAAIWRVAVKTFDAEKKISEIDFTALLNIARYSPSSFGLEPWKIIVVQDKDLRLKMSEFATGAKKQLATASHFVIFTVTTDLEATSNYYKHIIKDIKKLNEEAYSEFVTKFIAFQKEKLGLTDYRKLIDWAGKQTYIALGNMMLAAAILGIDSCPIEGFIPSAVEKILETGGHFNPAEEHIVVMCAFGYRQSDFNSPKIRRSLNEIVRFV